MAVVLQPQLQAVRAAQIPQAAHVVGGHAICHQPPQVPQEPVRLIGAAHDAAGQAPAATAADRSRSASRKTGAKPSVQFCEPIS